MYYTCCVPNCGSRRKSVRLHRFARTAIGLKWLECINCDKLRKLRTEELYKMYICHKHFEKKFVNDSLRLKSSAYPSLFTDEEMDTGSPAQVQENCDNHDQKHSSIDHDYTIRKQHVDHSYARVLPLSSNGELEVIPKRTSIPEPSLLSSLVPDENGDLILTYEQLSQLLSDWTQRNPPADGNDQELTLSYEQLSEIISGLSEPHEQHAAAPAPASAPAAIPVPSIATSTEPQANEINSELTSFYQDYIPEEAESLSRDDDVELPATPPPPSDDAATADAPVSRPVCATRKRFGDKLIDIPPQCLYSELKKAKRKLELMKAAKKKKYTKRGMFDIITKKMNPIAKKFFWMQVRLCDVAEKGRRFDGDEKAIAYSFFKLNRQTYKVLKKMFVLPCRKTMKVVEQKMAKRPVDAPASQPLEAMQISTSCQEQDDRNE